MSDHLAQLHFFVKSPLLLGRAVLGGMMQRRFGRIVQIDSEVVNLPPRNRSAYVTAKSAQIGPTRAWARELADLGITVNTVAPAWLSRTAGGPANGGFARLVRPSGHLAVTAAAGLVDPKQNSPVRSRVRRHTVSDHHHMRSV